MAWAGPALQLVVREAYCEPASRPPYLAETGGATPDREAVQLEFEQAANAFRQKQMAEAARLAESAFLHGAGHDALELLAVALLQSGDASRAFQCYSTLAADASAPGGVRGRAQRQVDALSRQTARATVVVSPHGARVLLDGKPIGTAPLSSEIVAWPGDHEVAAEGPGLSPAAKRVRFDRRKPARVELSLAPSEDLPPPVPLPPPPVPEAPTEPEVHAVEPRAVEAPMPLPEVPRGLRSQRVLYLVSGERRLAASVVSEGDELVVETLEGARLRLKAADVARLAVSDDNILRALGARVRAPKAELDPTSAPRVISLPDGRQIVAQLPVPGELRTSVVDLVSGEVVEIENRLIKQATLLGAVDVLSTTTGARRFGQIVGTDAEGRLEFRGLDGVVVLLPADGVRSVTALRPMEQVVLASGRKVVGHILENGHGQVIVELADRTRLVERGEQMLQSVLSPWAAGLSIAPDVVKVERKGIGFEARIRLDEAEARRRAWAERGGLLATYEVHANGIGMFSTHELVEGCSVTDGGGGGGAGGRVGAVFLGLSDTPSAVWTAVKATIGVDWSVLAMTVNSPNPALFFDSGGGEGDCGVPTTVTSNQVNLPFTISGQLALGSPDEAGEWSGVLFGLGWAPAMSIQIPSQGDPQTDVNVSGFEFTIDFATLTSAIEGLAQEAHFRITAFALPPTTEGGYWVGTLGLGAVWY